MLRNQFSTAGWLSTQTHSDTHTHSHILQMSIWRLVSLDAATNLHKPVATACMVCVLSALYLPNISHQEG